MRAASLIVHGNGLSQPSRAVVWFCEHNAIPYQFKLVKLLDGANRTPEYTKINPMQKVPAIQDGDFLSVFESHAILRYLAARYQVANHWYPKDLVQRTWIDQYLDWHHASVRDPCMSLLVSTVLARQFSLTENPAKARSATKRVEAALDHLETVWLKHGPTQQPKHFINGECVSIADLSCFSEFKQLDLLNYDVGKGRPKVAAWWQRMHALPGFEPTHKVFHIYVRKMKSQQQQQQGPSGSSSSPDAKKANL
ncbi:Glutathione S-transferase theta 2 [Balamuthia mandrillaris]